MYQLHRWKRATVFLTIWWGLWGAWSGNTIAYAEPSAPIVAYVKTITGDAWVNTNGQANKAALGMAIFKGSVLKTGAHGSLGVTFTDNTVMSFGADTELVVDEYLYAPNQSQFQLNVNLVKGTLNYISGLIAKLKPESVTVKTPTGIIGVRGTQFVVHVEP